MPRFVILEHDWPHLHWDFMLEHGDVLRTWRLAAAPRDDVSIVADPLGDHRKMYLDYEGPLSDGRGRVVRWDSGVYDEIEPEANDDAVTFRLHGERLRGEGTIRGGRFYFKSDLPDTGTT